VCGAVEVSPEERSVAKILVADDNSNIQKMVGLALKDHGIEVVAVGNGEAAVRKISDVRPDLVLADVFMPVRNGYEVCKYVKEDSSLAHIPVILLVGAFDPLDEQEAQRVGADGVLKKPFVPPDPLISMVKSALMRASTAQAAAAAEKAAVPAMAGTTAKTVASTSVPTQTFAVPQEEAPMEPFVDEIPPKVEELKIESTGQPLAFGSLMETGESQAVDDTATFVAPPSPELADRDWNAAEAEDDEEEEDDSAGSSWRRDAGSEDLAADPVTEKAADKAGSRGKRRESWTPTREKTQDLLEEAAAPEISALPVPSRVADVPAMQSSWDLPKIEPQLVESKAKFESPAAAKVEIAPAPVANVSEVVTQETAKTNGTSSWFSTTSSPWEAEAQKASQLASTWDAPAAAVTNGEGAAAEAVIAETGPVETAEPPAEPTYDFVSEAPSEEPVNYVSDPGLVQNEVVEHKPLPELISDGSISPETVENIRQETAYALESVTDVEEPPKPAAKITETSQQDMDALVANVLAKMSPEMLQAVTREILKPVVAAMIRDEITKKS
jgi:CheY-like chemotaxis protein